LRCIALRSLTLPLCRLGCVDGWLTAANEATLFNLRRTHKTPDLPGYLSEDARDFLQHCFVIKPAARSDATKLLQHRFVTVNLSPMVRPSSPRLGAGCDRVAIGGASLLVAIRFRCGFQRCLPSNQQAPPA
jgi:hypothetical protein